MADGDRLEPVRAYYQARGESELHRLDNPYEGVVEREIHRRAFEELLPAGARVLDLGGGPGHWTAWLLRRGHRVVLADLSPEMLTIARRELGAAGLVPDAIVECDARDLAEFGDGEFDAVLALGPFYHLVEISDREAARAEVRRVLRPGGMLLATVMMRQAWMLSTLLSGVPHVGGLEHLMADGIYRSREPGPLTEAYLFRPAEVASFFESEGFTTVAILASQGFLNQVQEQVAELRERDPAAWAELIDVAYRQAGDASIHGLSGHLLYAGRRGLAV